MLLLDSAPRKWGWAVSEKLVSGFQTGEEMPEGGCHLCSQGLSASPDTHEAHSCHHLCSQGTERKGREECCMYSNFSPGVLGVTLSWKFLVCRLKSPTADLGCVQLLHDLASPVPQGENRVVEDCHFAESFLLHLWIECHSPHESGSPKNFQDWNSHSNSVEKSKSISDTGKRGN